MVSFPHKHSARSGSDAPDLLQLDRLQVPHLRPRRPGITAVLDQVRPAPRAVNRRLHLPGLIRCLGRLQPEPLRPGCPPRLRSADRSRCDVTCLRCALAAGPPDEGGLDEFDELLPCCARNAATSASNAEIRALASSWNWPLHQRCGRAQLARQVHQATPTARPRRLHNGHTDHDPGTRRYPSNPTCQRIRSR